MNSKFNLYFGSVISYPVQYAGRAIRWTWRLQVRERTRLSQEMRQIKGLMPLVMKQRNGYRWSPADKSEMKVHLRHLVRLSPYLTLVVMPGGFVVLPFLAWWLDRRRQKRLDLRS